MPQDIAKKFIQYAEDNNYEAAAKLFTSESLDDENYSSVFGNSFKGFCDHFKKNDQHRISGALRGKGDSFYVDYSAQYNSNKNGYTFYFISRDGILKMHKVFSPMVGD